jgi:hypothetical protein
MIDLQEYKDSLGNSAKDLTEGEILKLRNDMDKMAEIFFTMWLSDRKKK